MNKAQKSGQILQENEDFKVTLVDWRGQPAVRKEIQPTIAPGRGERLQNEAYAMGFLTDLAAEHPEVNLFIPKLYEIKKDYLVREYVEAKPIVAPGMAQAEVEQRLDKLTQQLASIDRIKPYGETKFVGHFDYRDIRKNMAKWAAPPLSSDQITQEQVEGINKIIEPLLPYLRPRISHGDLSPHRHAYLLDDGRIMWIDLENFTPSGTRYYDVVRAYVRLFSFEPSTDTAKHFLKSFLDKADKVEHMEEQLMAIMAQRSLGMQYDAWYDATNAGNDYRDRAKELLDLVLQNKPELLYSTGKSKTSQKTTNLKAVIFDLFGVLTTEGFRVFCDKYFDSKPEDRLKAQQLMDKSNMGHMSYKEFENGLAELSGVDKEVVHGYLSNNQANEPLFDYIRKKLKPRYKIGLLSNSSANWLPELFLAKDLQLLDEITLSFMVGITKPNPEIYKLAAKKLGVKPSECVFIDDVDRYCEGARNAGMQAIHYKDFEHMKTELVKLLTGS
ncbi:MAG TPA: HAD-IA family hydrolase [Candidatus Saccharimonadales bacterium]|nr:HAD-IA family hydrolase [Candidatus Saccharimonadales bacterium]